jgi:transcriptional regulator with XRE-family HTH domain
MREIRKNLKFSKKEIANKSFVSDKTIRRYEAGESMPSFDILEILSPYYKTDLVNLLIKHRLDDYHVFHTIKKRIDMKLGNQENDLQLELKDLNILLISTQNNYLIDLINQYKIFIEAIELSDSEKVYLAYEKFINAIEVTKPRFDFEKYASYTFFSMEVRILVNIALLFYKLDRRDKYLQILEFCIDAIDSSDEVCPMVCNNLAGAYFRIADYEKTLEYSNIGIKSCLESESFNYLYNLYYTKGVAEYRLDMDDYMESLKTSIYLCKAYKKDNLKDIIIERCRDYLGVDLS